MEVQRGRASQKHTALAWYKAPPRDALYLNYGTEVLADSWNAYSAAQEGENELQPQLTAVREV